MAEAYIVDALRTPTGRRRGGLAHVHAADLGAHVLRTLVDRNAIPADEYDDVLKKDFGGEVLVPEQDREAKTEDAPEPVDRAHHRLGSGRTEPVLRDVDQPE